MSSAPMGTSCKIGIRPDIAVEYAKKGLECEMSIRSNVAAHQKSRHCMTHCVLLLHAVPSFPFPYD
jgi:hypothetical protein